MEKRPPTGIWGGLWTPLSSELTEEPKKYIKEIYGINISTTEENSVTIMIPNFLPMLRCLGNKAAISFGEAFVTTS